MSTTRYSQGLAAVSDGTFDVQNVDLNVKLVTEDYIPDTEHVPEDVDKYIINGVSTLMEDYFASNVMSNIIAKTKEKMELGFNTFPEEICAEVDKVITDETKREKLKELIRMPNTNNFQFGQDLKDNGIKYFVVESVPHGILCFCEEIEM